MRKLCVADSGLTSPGDPTDRTPRAPPVRPHAPRRGAGRSHERHIAARGARRGSVIGARVTLALAPDALDELAAGRRIAVVSGTNGKSTTTALLAAACSAGGLTVASNVEGANLRSGIVALLSSRRARNASWPCSRSTNSRCRRCFRASRHRSSFC